MDRIFNAWTAIFIFRLWCYWINEMDKDDLDSILLQLSGVKNTFKNKKSKTKRQYFITYQSHFSVEINGHSLIYLALLVSEGTLPIQALNIWLQNSQSCESSFRSARAISSVASSGVNFTVSQFLNRINKLLTLQTIKNNTHLNNLRFPQHHKLSTTFQSTTNSTSTTVPSKADIENTVLNAYKFVTKLFNPLKIKELLRNGQIISIEELSNTISHQLDKFWSEQVNNTAGANISSDSESDGEIDNDITNNYGSDEESDFEYNPDLIDNVSVSASRGIRLFNNVKDELAHTYFHVTINNENKFLHKQAACWLLEKDKSSLSADRLSRVRGE